jgi:hypothetical protein
MGKWSKQILFKGKSRHGQETHENYSTFPATKTTLRFHLTLHNNYGQGNKQKTLTRIQGEKETLNTIDENVN